MVRNLAPAILGETNPAEQALPTQLPGRLGWAGDSPRDKPRADPHTAAGARTGVSALRGPPATKADLFLCAEYGRQLGGESPLSSLMVAKD